MDHLIWPCLQTTVSVEESEEINSSHVPFLMIIAHLQNALGTDYVPGFAQSAEVSARSQTISLP